MKFRNENDGISEDGTFLDRNIGNVTVSTATTVEYMLKPQAELDA
jgi:hypothetical protein